MNIHQSFEAKTRANMKAIRARLMGKPVKLHRPKLDPLNEAKIPEWLENSIFFDEHVKAYRKFMMYLAKPHWQRVTDNFSQHVLDFTRFKMSLEKVQTEVDEIYKPYLRKPLPEICREVLDLLGSKISLDELRGIKRSRIYVEPRQYVCWAIHNLRPDISYPRMGHFLGGRDHTTTLFSVRKINELVENGTSKLVFDGVNIKLRGK